MNNLSLDKFENGIVHYQDECLYKFTSDSIKLAKFCKIKPTDSVLDMCAGSGVIGLYAYSVNKFNKIYFNEIQDRLCELIDKNIKINKLENKAKVLCKDLKQLTLNDFDEKLDIILCNPPYFKASSKVNNDISKAMCRHEIATNLVEIISKVGELLNNKCKFYLVVPSDRLCEAVILLNKNKFEVKNMEMYHSGNKSTICLLESVKNAKSGVKIKIIKESL